MAGQILQVCEHFNLQTLVHNIYRVALNTILEMNTGKGISNKTPTTDSISVSDVLYQLSSLRKVSKKNLYESCL